jgi:hypothetical protein
MPRFTRMTPEDFEKENFRVVKPKTPPETPKTPEKENPREHIDRLLAPWREALGHEHVLGITALEAALTLHDGTMLWTPSTQEQQEYANALESFLAEPDITALLEQIKQNKEYIPEGVLFTLLPQTLTDPAPDTDTQAQGHASKTVPATMAALNRLLAPDMHKQNQGALMSYTKWCKEDPFFTTDTPSARILLTTRDVVPETLNKNHTDQTTALKTYATAHNIDPTKLHRPTPIDTILAHALATRTAGTRQLLQKKIIPHNYLPYHWTDTRSTAGKLVRLGNADADGVDVLRLDPANAYEFLGSLLSRRG